MFTNSKIEGGKLNKAFTLIELLAVIIILAVIALIATPIVLNVIENSRKESNKNSAYGILDAAKLYYTESMLDTTKTGINGKTNLLDVVSITGKAPNSGTLYIADSGLVAIAVVYDDYCFKKEFNEQDLTETTTDNCSVTAQESSGSGSGSGSASTFGGTVDTNTYTLNINSVDVEQAGLVGVAYLDPTDLTTTCNASLAAANVNSNNTPTGITSGCMRFYIFDDTGDNYTMILDHNTSGDVAWNSSNSNASMNEVATQLSTDTNGWVGSPRLITAQEIYTITDGPSTWDVSNSNTGYYFGSKNSSTDYSSQTAEQKAVQQSYAWLFDNLNQSTNYGGTVEDNNKYPNANNTNYIMNGYWTSSAVSGSANYVWFVTRGGSLDRNGAFIASLFGVRPVITLAKSQLQ